MTSLISVSKKYLNPTLCSDLKIESGITASLDHRSADKLLAEGREHACLQWLVCVPIEAAS